MKYLIALNIILVLGIVFYNNNSVTEELTDPVEEPAIEVSQPDINETSQPDDLTTIEIVLQKQYLDGRMDTESYEETITAMEDFWYAYEDYQLMDQKVGQMVFREYIDDISPYLKEVGYFGLADQQLVIYEGEPQYNQNIQTLYDLNVTGLSDAEQAQLTEGIKIETKQIYQEVIDVFRNLIPSEEVHGESD